MSMRRLCFVFQLVVLTAFSNLSFARSVDFSAVPPFDLGRIRWVVATGDLNKDGNVDIVGIQSDTGLASVWFGNGDGTFRSGPNLHAGNDPTVVTIGDANGDHNPDIVLANLDGQMTILFGDGEGAFSDPTSYGVGGLLTQPFGPYAITLGDINRDGIVDIVIGYAYGSYGNEGGNNIAIKLGTGNGTFGSAKFVAGGTYIASLQIVDVNDDEIPDLIAANRDSGSSTNRTGGVAVLLGNGDGIFHAPTVYTTGLFVWEAASADLNGDSVPDLVVSNSESDTISLLYGNGDGTFQAPINFPVQPGPTGIKVADFDKDGKNDILVTSGSAGVSSCDLNILWNLGDGNFRTQAGFLQNAHHSDMSAVADFNNDGALDVAPVLFTNNATFAINVLLNTGGTRGVLTSSLNPSVQTDPVTVTAAISGSVSNTVAPTGTVVFSSENDILGTASIDSGTATLTVSSLKAGSHSIVAAYSGDQYHVPVTYTALSQQVNRIPTTTVLLSASESAVYGSTISLSIAVSGERPGTPTGSVVLYQGSNSIGSVSLNSGGNAIFDVSLLSAGILTFTAQYDGDADFASSSSTGLSIDVAKAPSTVSFTSSSNPSAVGATITFTVSVSGGNVVPSGQVVLQDGSTDIATAVLDSTGHQRITISALQPGTRQLRVVYRGDDGHIGSTSSVVQQNIADFTATSNGSASQIRAGQSSSFSLTFSGTGGLTGNIALSCSGAPPLGSCALNPNSLPVTQNPATATVTVRTVGPNATAAANRSPVISVCALACMAPFLMFGAGWKRLGLKHRLVCLALVFLLGLAACGGGGTDGGNKPPPTTPSGQYTVTVTATTTFSGAVINHSFPFTVTVTQ